MTLWEINQEIAALIDPDTGEVIDFDALAALSMAREEKLENIACLIKNLRTEAEGIKTEEAALAERRKAKEAKAERLKEWLARELAGEAFETARCAVSFRKSKAVEIADEGAVLTWLCDNGHQEAIKVPAPAVSKEALKKILAAGENVRGADLIERQNISIK